MKTIVSMEKKMKMTQSTITFDTKVIKPNLCNYSDAYVLVTGDIAVVNGNQNTSIAFKNCCLLLDVLLT